jgi:hypothetical protein
MSPEAWNWRRRQWIWMMMSELDDQEEVLMGALFEERGRRHCVVCVPHDMMYKVLKKNCKTLRQTQKSENTELRWYASPTNY